MSKKKEKVLRIKSERYRLFIGNEAGRAFNPVSRQEFDDFLARVVHPKDTKQARALVILLYYSARRPGEAVIMQATNFKLEPEYLTVFCPTLKRGRPTTIYLPLNDHTQELWKYVQDNRHQRNLFWAFLFENKPRNCDLNYWFKKWQGMEKPTTKRFPPYFFRHNRLSTMAAAGWTIPELQQFKGAKSEKSVFPYVWLTGRDMAKALKKGGFD